MADGGEVRVKITADNSDAKAKTKETEDGFSSLGSKAKGALGAAGKAVAAGAVAAAGAFAGITTAALKAYASYEQLVGGVDTLFKDASGQVQAYAASAYKTAGLSANQYMEQATSFSARLIQGLGGDTKAAAEAANTAITDMSDNVNKMGSSMTDVQNAYQGFAKQNYTMLDNLKLGYGGTQSEMARLINDSGVLGDTMTVTAENVNDVSFDKIIEAIHTVQERMGITGTTAKEAATTIEGSVGMMSAAWENWLTGLGRDDVDMGALTTQLLDAVGTVIQNVAPRVALIGSKIVEALPGALSGAAAVLAPVLSQALADAWNAAVQALAGLGISLPQIDASQVQGALQAIVDAFNGLWTAVEPIISTVFTGLQSAIEATLPYVQPLVDAFTSFGEAVLPLVEVAVTGIMQWLQVLLPGIVQVVTIVLNGAAQIITAGGQLLAFITQVVVGIGMVIAELLGFFAGLPGKIGGFLMDVAGKAASWASDMASKASQAGSQFLGNVGSFLSQLPGKAWGFLSSAIGRAASFAGQMASKATEAGSRFLSGVSNGLNSAVRFVAGIPGRIVSAMGNLGSLLLNAGKSIVAGLKRGIESAIKGVYDFVGGIGKKIASLKGPIPYDLKLLVPNGEAIMEGLRKGIRSGLGSVLAEVEGIAPRIDSSLSLGTPSLNISQVAAAGAATGGGVTVYVDGAIVNDNAAIRTGVYDTLDELWRIHKIQGGR